MHVCPCVECSGLFYKDWPGESFDRVAKLAQGWGNSVDVMLQFIDDLVYNSNFDASLKTGLKARKTPEEIIAYGPIKERLDEVIEALKKETPTIPPGNDSASSALGGEGQATSNPSAAGGAASMPGQGSVTKAGGGTDGSDSHWWAVAERIVKANIQLFVEPKTEGELMAIFDQCTLKDSVGAPGSGYVGCILDVKTMTEPVSQPHKRVGPCKKDKIIKLVGAWLKSRATQARAKDGMKEGDALLLLDGGKHGNQIKFLAPVRDFCGAKHFSKKVVNIVYDEDSVMVRKSRVKGVSALRQQEWLHVVSRTAFDVPLRKRKHYVGTNRGSTLAFVKLPTWGSSWMLPFEIKRRLYGRNRVDVGGRAEGDDDDDDVADSDEEQDAVEDDNNPPCFVDGVQTTPQVRAAKNLEPVCYQSLPTSFHEETLDSYYIKELYELTPWDGAVAKAALLGRKGYVGICHTDVHVAELYKMLTAFVLQTFQVQDSVFFQAGYAALKGVKPGTDDDPKPTTSKPQRPPGKGKAKKGDKKKKKRSKSSLDGPQSSDSSSSGSGMST